MSRRRTVGAYGAAILAGLLIPCPVLAQTAGETGPTKAASAAGQEAAAKPPGASEAGEPAPAASGAVPASPDQSAVTPAAPERPPAHPIVAYVREKLSQSPARGVDRGDWEALAASYAERSEPPLWVTETGFTARARAAMAEIARADDWGLSAAAFELPKVPTSIETAGEAEIKLGLAVLEYARHARGGRVEPSRISRNFDQKPPLRDPKKVLEEIAAASAADVYLRSLHPKHVQFERLRQALLKARGTAAKPKSDNPADMKLPDGPNLQMGIAHPHVGLLRRRLGLKGEAAEQDVFDEELEAAVKAYQRENGFVDDGIVGPRTRSALNGQPAGASNLPEIERLIVNMERWRWMPETLGDFYVWDNIPEFYMRVVKNGKLIHAAKIVVGKPDTQTPIFSADMRYIVFHPDWGVPNSIKIKEILPYLRPTGGGFFGFGMTDTRILERHNLRVSRAGRPVDASMIDWTRVDIRQFDFIQPPGPGNVLGVVKFRFPNKHDVYMHDTPQRELFDRPVRTYSHGCMRVQDPVRLAEVLLAEDKGWSAAQVRRLVNEGSENNQIELTRRIPVHVTYFTAMVDDEGMLRWIADPYGHDSRVAAALAGRPLPPERLDSTTDYEPPREARSRPPRPFGPRDVFSGLFGN